MFSTLFPRHPGTEVLASAVRACRAHLVWAALFSALVNLLYLAPTLYMMQVYDRVVPTGGLFTLMLLTVVAMFALATLAGLDWLRARLLIRISLRLDRILSARILERVLEMRDRPPASQVMREFDNVRTAISGQSALALFDAPWTPIYLGCCFFLHPAIGVLTLTGGAILVGLGVLNEKSNRSKLNRAMLSASQAYASNEAVAHHAEAIRALGMSRASVNRQVRLRRLATSHYADAQFDGGRYSGVIRFLRLAMQSISLGLAAFLAVKGQISPGSIIAASVLLSRAVAPVELLVGAWPNLVQARQSWKNLTELFASTAGVERPRTSLPDPRGSLLLETVSVRLSETADAQIRGVSLALAPGQSLGIVGPSGSGKTTLARVIAGAVTPTTGTVRLDGADYLARTSDDLARHIGYLPQNPSLFPGSVKDNISRFSIDLGGDPDEIDARTIAAAQAAGVHDMILQLGQGYDTVLGTAGAGVSAGQTQRIALARALYGDPALLVLDEPNSALDQEGEVALMTAILAATARGAAVVIVAHRAGILSRADRLLTLRDGAVQMEGPREEVLTSMQNAAARARERPR